MKNLILFILFIGISVKTIAQSASKTDIEESYAVIHDPDGFVNVRQEKSAKSPIQGKIYNDDIFTCFPDNSDWWKIVQLDNGKTDNSNLLEGYIHKNRIVLLSHWKPLNKKDMHYKDSSVFKNDSLNVVVKKALFNARKHKLKGKSNFVSTIDGKAFWGTDGEIPKQAISSVRVNINGVPVFIPKDAFNDLYEPNLENLSIGFGSQGTIYILMLNSDGAGSYTVIWTIKNNKYQKRYIDNIDA